MDTLNNLFTRRSVREFLDKEVPQEVIHTILAAGMSGPSAVNARPWQFLVVQDKAQLERMAEANGRAAGPLKGAAFGVLICGDLEKAFPRAPDFWTVDAAIATQNMILAAHELGVGSVWLGTWPMEDKVQAQTRLFSLPQHIIPHSIVAFGYPKEEKTDRRDQYEADKVHFEKW